MEYAISQPKLVRLPLNEKQTYQLNSRPQMWPLALTLAMTWTLNFQGQVFNLLYLMTKLSNCHEMKNECIDLTIGLKCSHQFWPWPWSWPWIFKVKYLTSCISRMAGWIDKKKTHKGVSWMLSQQCDLDLWPNAWPWPWHFKVKFWNSCISGIGGPIEIKQNGCESTIHGHDCGSLVTKVRCKG